jgi:MSHA biogenesis protein MshP
MLVIALFVIIVLALLGLTMTRLLSSSSEAIIHEVLGQRALNAARTGIECAIANKINAPVTSCANALSKEFSGVAGLENCQYNVIVNDKPIVDTSKTFTYLTFSSTGQCSAGKVMVSRTLYIDAML